MTRNRWWILLFVLGAVGCTTEPSTPVYPGAASWGVQSLVVDGRPIDVSAIEVRRFDPSPADRSLIAAFKICNSLRFSYELIEIGSDAMGLRTVEAVSTAAACPDHAPLEDALRQVLRSANQVSFGAERIVLESASSRLTMLANP